MTFHGNQRHRGFTLLELALVLVIAAIVTAGSIMLYSRMSTVSRVADTVQEIREIERINHALNMGQGDYGVTTVDVIRSGELSAKWVTGAAAGNPWHITSPFGGYTALGSAATIGFHTNYSTYLELTDIPDDACVMLMTADLGPLLLHRMVDWRYGDMQAGPTPMTPERAASLCLTPVWGGHQLVWEFY